MSILKVRSENLNANKTMITNEIPFDTACDLAMINVSFIACTPLVSQVTTKGGTQLQVCNEMLEGFSKSCYLMSMNVIVIVQEMWGKKVFSF